MICTNLNKGSALISALWTVALLSLLVMAFAVDANLEAKLVTYTRTKRQSTYLIRSGICIAELVLDKQSKVTGSETIEEVERDRWIKPAVSLKRGQITYIDEPLSNGVIHIEIEPEPARWNINKLVPMQGQDSERIDAVWAQIFMSHGFPEDYYLPLIACFNDWTDTDSIADPDGAEDEYYTMLDPPYRTKNGLLSTKGELSLVKGFTDTVLYGGVINPEAPPDNQIQVKGIDYLFTVHGEDTLTINVNAAGKDVLMTVPGMDELLAGAIIEEREGRGESVASQRQTNKMGTSTEMAFEDFSFKNTGDVSARIPGIPSSTLDYLSTSIGTYRLTIEGRIGAITRRVQAIVTFSDNVLQYVQYREDP